MPIPEPTTTILQVLMDIKDALERIEAKLNAGVNVINIPREI